MQPFLQNPLTLPSALNTLWIFMIAGGLPLLLGWLFGLTAARPPAAAGGDTIGILFGAGSLSAFHPRRGWHCCFRGMSPGCSTTCCLCAVS